MGKRRGTLSEEELNLIRNTDTEEEAFKAFFRDCRLRNLRPATIVYYRREIEAAKKRMEKPLTSWKERDVEEFILTSKDATSVTSINTRLRALRSFFNFVHKKKIIKKNPMKNIKLLRDRKKEIETLDNKEIELLLNTIRKKKTFVSFRDEVILLVFLDTGVRLSELVGIEVDDIQGNKIRIRMTKNLFERTVYISEITQEQISKYLKLRGEVNTNKLFISQDDKELNRHSIQTRFQKYGKEANIGKRVSPHTFRHTMAKRMIMSGVDAFTLMTILGHSDMTITKRYVNLWGPDIEKKHRQYGALNGLKI